MLLSVVFAVAQLPPIKPFMTELRDAVMSGNRPRIERLFKFAADDAYLFRMAEARGIRNLKVAVIPVPPGWEQTGSYWAVIHTRQDIEDHHDPVYPIVVSGVEWKLGHEIPEDATTGVEPKFAQLDVHILPATHSVDIRSTLYLTITAQRRAPLFRLGDQFKVSASPTGRSIEAGDALPAPMKGDWVHAGSLLVPWDTQVNSSVLFAYSGTLDSPSEDKVDEKACYVTAWWVPTLGRLPFKTATRVVGPKDWTLQSEGLGIATPDAGPFAPGPTEQLRAFKCDIPISYPKVIGGRYIKTAEKQVAGRTYRAYHFEHPGSDHADDARAQKDVQTIADSIAWYEQHLGPFPFSEYNCYDADTYYGIESYNYTLLKTNITSWAVSHEAGHTYFGGLVPCAYVHDSWNESMTQYVDSVLRLNNADHTLEGAMATLRLKVPLTEMPVAQEYGGATYMRGAYVLRMLEQQIGTENMYRGMRALIADRVGKDTTWYDLRTYFERASGKKLDWFWSQWVSGATFPNLTITDAQGFPSTSGTEVHVTVRQSGTADPFRLRFKVFARGRPSDEKSQLVDMDSPEATFIIKLGKGVTAYEAGLDTFGYVLTPKVPPVRVKI